MLLPSLWGRIRFPTRLWAIVDYQLIAFESLLWQAAVRREDLLRNFYRILEKAGTQQAPYAFVFPKEQLDPGSAKKLLETMSFGAVEVEQASEVFTADGGERPVRQARGDESY